MIELHTLIDYVQDSEDATIDSRRLSERDRDYYDNIQLTAEQKRVLTKRKQPPVVINRIKPKIDFLRGMEQQVRTDPKAFPRTPQHEQDAESATDSIRYVTENNNYDQVRSDVFDNILIEGQGGIEIYVKSKGDSFDIVTKRIPWDRQVLDPHSRERDASDARYKGIIIWQDLAEAKRIYKGKEEILETTYIDSSDSNTSDDVPRVRWSDTTTKRVKLVQLYYLDNGTWMHTVFTKAGHLVEPKPSVYLDEDGRPDCPIELQAAYVDRDGNRYGVARQFIDIQDEINKRRSKALHLMTVNQVVADKGAVEDVQKAKIELAKPDGYIEVTPQMRFDIAPSGEMAASQFSLLQEAKDEIDAVGVNAALAGKEERNLSGRALLARQQGGQTELGPLFDSLRMLDKRVYRHVWNRIRQFWTEERWIRVTDDEKNLKWVGLNQPILLGDDLAQQFGGIPPAFQNDPRLKIPIGVQNNVADLDVDIVIEDAPDVVNIQSEQFEMLVQMYQAAPDKIPFDLVIEASSLRNKERLLETLNGGDEEQQAAQAQEQEKQAQMANIANEAQIKKLISEAEKTQAEARKVNAEADMTELETVVAASQVA